MLLNYLSISMKYVFKLFLLYARVSANESYSELDFQITQNSRLEINSQSIRIEDLC